MRAEPPGLDRSVGIITGDTPKNFEEFARGRDLYGATIVLDSTPGSYCRQFWRREDPALTQNPARLPKPSCLPAECGCRLPTKIAEPGVLLFVRAPLVVALKKAILPSAPKRTMWKTSSPMSMPIEARAVWVVSIRCFSGCCGVVRGGSSRSIPLAEVVSLTGGRLDILGKTRRTA